jgi:hypothetical protein
MKGNLMAKSPIVIYAHEVSDGIADAVAAQHSIAYLSPVLRSPSVLQKQLVTEQVLAAAQEAVGSDVTFDLYPIHTILVTTGWNKNDDIFTKGETWIARFTPEDKPFNIGHDPRQNIGHITANTVVDDDLAVVAADSAFDDVPDKFHILTSAVIYRHINSRDEALEAEAAALIESIQKGDWYVSMECLFAGFDYGVTYASGEHEIVRRDQSTAFLTKHLRVHGGCGEYNGGKLGRALKHITFSGKGLVENPANPESVIFNDTKRFVGVFASSFQPEDSEASIARNSDNLGESLMADTDKYTGQLEDQIKSLQSDLAEANRKVDELGEATVKSALAEKDSEIAALQSKIAEAEAKIEELTASYNDATKAKEVAEAEKADVDTKLTEATDKLTEIEKTSKTVARVATLVDSGVDKEQAEAVAAEFDGLDDEKFEKVVEMQATIAKKDSKKKDDSEEDDKSKADADDKSEEDDPEGEASADDADLDDAKADEDPVMGTDDADQDELMPALASFLDTSMHGDDEASK